MEKFIEPILIKAGSRKVLLGQFRRPPVFDIRVITEAQYQRLIKMSGILNSDNVRMILQEVFDLTKGEFDDPVISDVLYQKMKAALSN